jgi:hypothetical protein
MMDVDTPTTSGWTEVPVEVLPTTPSSSISVMNVKNLRLRSSAQAFYGDDMISKSKLRTVGRKIDCVEPSKAGARPSRWKGYIVIPEDSYVSDHLVTITPKRPSRQTRSGAHF